MSTKMNIFNTLGIVSSLIDEHIMTASILALIVILFITLNHETLVQKFTSAYSTYTYL